MRPKLLKIKGMHSYLEEQVIDFSKLTDHGLFGIFGPTASGKSTILDAMIYALYGSIPRNSKEIINAEADGLYVYYSFALEKDGARRIYVCERSITRKKSGELNSPSAKLFVQNGTEVEVLADKVRGVNEAVEQLIGLSAEDFTRSVVLPQGKFSEFLTLSGRDRRDMLERIFGLEQYGQVLTVRINRKKAALQNERSKLEGQLTGYTDITEAQLVQLKLELEQLRAWTAEAETAKALALANYEATAQRWNWQAELTALLAEGKSLEVRQPEINEKRIRLVEGKRAAQVRPHWIEYERTCEEVTACEADFFGAVKNREACRTAYQKAKERLDQRTTEWEGIAALTGKLRQAEQAMDKQRWLSLKTAEREVLRRDYRKGEQALRAFEAERETLTKRRDQLAAERTAVETQLTALRIGADTRSLLREGSTLTNQRETLRTEWKKNGERLVEKVNWLESLRQRLMEKERELAETRERLESRQRDVVERGKCCPGDGETLEQRANGLNISENLLQDKEGGAAEQAKWMAELRLLQPVRERLENAVEKERMALAELEQSRRVAECENMAAVLAASLVDGTPCPVCGSVHHPAPAETTAQKALFAADEVMETRQSALSALEQNAAKVELQTKVLEENLRALSEKYGDTILPEYMDRLRETRDRQRRELDMLKENISIWNEEMQGLTQEMQTLTVAVAEQESECKHLMENIAVAEKERTSFLEQDGALADALHQVERALVSLRGKLTASGIDARDLKAAAESQEEKDRELEKLTETQMQLDQERTVLDNKWTELSNRLEHAKEALAEIKSKGQELAAVIRVGTDEIVQLVGEKNPEAYGKALSTEIGRIERAYAEEKKNCEALERERQAVEQEAGRLDGVLTQLRKTATQRQAALQEALAVQQLESVERAKEKSLEEAHMAQLEQELRSYEEAVRLNESNVARMEALLGEVRIAAEAWALVQSEKVRTELRAKELGDTLLLKQQAMEEMARKLSEAEALRHRLAETDQRLNLVKDLASCLSGNKFVEYLANRQLNYIAKDASERLKMITKGRYALELDESSFVMRDDFSGGTRRSTASLSGGETFFTALSLALALSAKAQMRGSSASMEFFFLDEGFGTLDTELLDTVMRSLESLYTEKLSVGIISHVEELKNRVPIKLIVTPAALGEGTKVQLEYS